MSRNQGIVALMGFAMLAWLVLLAQAAPADQHEAGEQGRPGGSEHHDASSGASASMGRAAQAQITPIDTGDVTGTITFQQQEDLVRVSGVIRGLSPGKHGFHIHEGTSCDERGGHFAPKQTPHGSPDAQQRHVGDLGNLAAGEDGEVAYLRVDRELSLSGPGSIVGHVVVVHQGEDDYVSQPSGGSGEEIACGRIELVPGDASAESPASPSSG